VRKPAIFRNVKLKAFFSHSSDDSGCNYNQRTAYGRNRSPRPHVHAITSVHHCNDNYFSFLFLTGLKHPFGITIFNGDIYWTDWIARSISKASTDGQNQRVLKTELPGIMDVCVFDNSRQRGKFYIVQQV
jgi:hypothetical protein